MIAAAAVLAWFIVIRLKQNVWNVKNSDNLNIKLCPSHAGQNS